jgi:hypothetical protein
VVGVTAIETSVAALTFSGAEPLTESSVAKIFATPLATPVATPPALLTVATAVLSEAQDTSFVMTCDVESLNDPVAVNPCFVPAAIVRPEGVTEIETMLAFVTLNGTESVTDPRVAVIVVGPGATPLARPVLAPIVATVVSEELQVT